MFRALTIAIWQRHPETPPYRGRHPDIIPHLCVARLSDRKQLEQVAQDLAPAAAAGLPIQATATEVALMDTRSGRWRTRTMLRLGSTKRSSD
jgi:hypothetical protein